MEGKSRESSVFSQVRGLWTNLFSTTHMHGLPHAYNARSPGRKIFWGFLFLCGLVACLYSVTENFRKYFSYPVQTRIEVISAYALPFPAITVCNQNPILASEVDAMALYDVAWANFQDINDTELAAYFYDYYDEHYEDPDFLDGFRDTFEQYNFEKLFSRLNMTQKTRRGHQLTKMLLGCYINGYQCTEKDFVHSINNVHGNCFTFNSGTNGTAPIQSKKAGPQYGLELELFIDQIEYTDEVSDVAGVRVVIANQTYMPFPDRYGFSAAPGTATYVSMQRVDYLRSSEPYGDCVSNDEFTEDELQKYNLWSHMYPHIGYSATACKLSCYQFYVNGTCGCGDNDFPLYGVGGVKGRIPPCTQEEDQDCMDRVLQMFINKELHCADYCDPLCEEVTYQTYLSFGQWPSQPKEMKVLESIIAASPEFNDSVMHLHTEAEKVAFLRANTLKVIIYFNNLEYEVVVTAPSYQIVDLLSDQGGQLGLWIGLSLLSLFELVELIWDLLKLISCSCLQTEKPRSPKSTAIDMV